MIESPSPDPTTETITVPTAVRVVGLDLSLTATGIATVGDTTNVLTLKSKGNATATLDERALRLHNLTLDIITRAVFGDTVVIEQPAYGQTGGSHHDRSGLWWLVVDALIPEVDRLIEVTPQTVKKYATGKGNASKDEVLAAVVRRYPNVPVANNNEADALILAAIGARLSGTPIESGLPLTHIDALAKVRWVA
ncbi:crossover junction endodeoxyribonuclease RuvC [Humibacter ginsenosidimutans]|uniref:Uncharacterized protein n=1 Tax=Humibacter ginsenosidimutans TaxID=2599293 RepID=A0A5B8M635_9MICO|nr:crossover junction endodeoxyribonuclease RuvC [Humibacter ginsenosidimutans]QDZ15803.1 hypothetical protein FPZ11_14440 [Humibacter ginsenosidimutans]